MSLRAIALHKRPKPITGVGRAASGRAPGAVSAKPSRGKVPTAVGRPARPVGGR
ncbi:hypothetical protein QZN11_26815 [Streptomyces gramineus]|uniref:hypothetical protein n=1 Tax=Streptomyces gramineus TaxID=910542 RepID=UPI00398BAA84